MTRYLMNDRTRLVADAVAGLEVAAPHLVRRHTQPLFLARAKPASDKVALVSGGGSGHEPLHVGFVGHGMLDAAVPGEVFSSPTAYQVKAAAGHVECGRGVLLVVKNYTGDVLNFSIAAELVSDSFPVRTVVVDDDLATAGMDDGGPGRRGTAAVVAVEKICGAAAEQGASLDDLAALGRRVNAHAATLAVAFAACTHPADGRPSFDLPAGQLEYGVGIHGERGTATRPVADARSLVADLVQPLLEAVGLRRGDDVIAIVNSLGATHGLELAVATHELARILDGRGVRLARTLVGPWVTALDMKGISITVVKADQEMLRLWDAPVHTPAWGWSSC